MQLFDWLAGDIDAPYDPEREAELLRKTGWCTGTTGPTGCSVDYLYIDGVEEVDFEVVERISKARTKAIQLIISMSSRQMAHAVHSDAPVDYG